MLEEILSENIVRVQAASSQMLFRIDVDYAVIVERYRNCVQSWSGLSPEQKTQYGSQKAYLEQHQSPNPNDPDLVPAKHFMLLRNEVTKRISSEGCLQLLPIDVIDFESSTLELIENTENTEHIRELYRLRKETTAQSDAAGIKRSDARRIKNCLSQGRELYIAGRNGSLMVKPLNFFYSLTAYAYGVIVLNNPVRFNKGNLPGSHGMQYLPGSIEAQFGGDTPKGTFSDLLTSFPTQVIKNHNLEIIQDRTDSVIKFYESKFTVGAGLLLSLIPEMRDYYKLIIDRNSRAFPLDIINANDPRSLKWEFHIGDGESRPPIDNVKVEFGNFPVSERHGKLIVTVPATEAHSIKACTYTDIRGKFWHIENPFYPIIMPEICVHFLLMNIFASIMRYRPDEWSEVLLNEVSSQVSLITRHYFSTWERKVLILLLRSISRFIPYAATTAS